MCDYNEIIDMIERINIELEDESENKEFINENLPVEFRTFGYECCITFYGITIWESCFDERPENRNDEDKMPLEQFIRQKINKMICNFKSLQKIKEF